MPLAIPNIPIREYAPPQSPVKYLFVAGTLGDVIPALGNAQALIRSTAMNEGRLIYFGPDPTIAPWLRIQPLVREVIDVRSPGPVSRIPTDPSKRADWVPFLAQVAGLRLKAGDVWPCHVDFTLREHLPVHRPELITAPDFTGWSKEVLGEVERSESLTLFQPRSETSCLWEGHWPYWNEAAQLLDRTDGTLLECGKGDFQPLSSGVNLINQTPMMFHLLALADRCAAVVTTSNALSHYAACKGLPTVVCCNTTHRRPGQFFTRFAKGERSEIVEHWEGMDRFAAAWEKVKPC